MTSMEIDLDKSLDEIAASNRKSNHNSRSLNKDFSRKPRGPKASDRDKGSHGTQSNARRSAPYTRKYHHHRPTPGGNVNGDWKHDLFYEGSNIGDHLGGDVERGYTRTFVARKRVIDKTGWGEYPGVNVRIKNIHWNVSESDLLELCQYRIPDCVVVDLKLLYDNAGRSEGIADVTFATDEDAEICVQELSGLAIDEQYLDVNFFNPLPQAQLPISQRLGKPKNIATRLGPLNVNTAAILKRLGGPSGDRGRSGGRDVWDTSNIRNMDAGKPFADALPTDTRVILSYEETITPTGI